VRKKPKIEDTPSPSIAGPPLPPIHGQDYRNEQLSPYTQQVQQGQPLTSHHYSSPYDPRFGWQNSTHSTIDSPVTSNYSRSTGQASPGMTSYPAQAPSQSSLDPSLGPRARGSIAIASADLQNPSDALDILARVADRADDDSAGSGQGNTPHQNQNVPTPWRTPPSPPKLTDHLCYKPVNDGLMGPELVYDLFVRYACRSIEISEIGHAYAL
jgi:hypothetical protein